LIVRSSSVLDSELDARLAGKYRSVVVCNQGSKQERVSAVLSAVAEVYASTFGPEPIKYRVEHGLRELGEEMGIMIQGVVGTRIGKYYLPTFSGIASSACDLTWLPDVKHDHALVQLVPGLNDEMCIQKADNYPVLVLPGYLARRVYTEHKDAIRYSPKQVCVVNFELESVITVTLKDLMQQIGEEIPKANQMVSSVEQGRLRTSRQRRVDFANDQLVVTFDGVISSTPFVNQINSILEVLEGALGGPVEIEFASDGETLYVLHCQRQKCSQ